MQPFKVALCQVQAFGVEEAETNLDNILRALDEAGAAGAQLVALPECAYPAYYLGGDDVYTRPGVRSFDEVAALFGEKARRYGYWLAAGMAMPRPGGALTNSGVVFGPDGTMQGHYDKQFLWHFDSRWFAPGASYPVWDTGFCRFGILICADSRQPEIARSLVVNGAEVIVDLTAWVSSGRSVPELTTTQCQYLMPVRARESGVWVVAADKWGSEAGTIVYAGRSSVIDPNGELLACAPSDRDQTATRCSSLTCHRSPHPQPRVVPHSTGASSIPPKTSRSPGCWPSPLSRPITTAGSQSSPWMAPSTQIASSPATKRSGPRTPTWSSFRAPMAWKAGRSTSRTSKRRSARTGVQSCSPSPAMAASTTSPRS
jgi:predicted amidohydrolase